jgi:hypothetical protein
MIWYRDLEEEMDRGPIEEDSNVKPDDWPIPSVFGMFSGRGLFTAAESEDWLLQSDFGSYEPVSPEELERIFGSVPALGTESEGFDDEIAEATDHALDSER